MLLANILPSVNMNSVIGVILMILTPFVVTWLKNHAAAAKAAADNSNFDVKEKLWHTLDAFFSSAAAKLLEEQAPVLARKIEAGQLTTEAQVDNELGTLAQQLKQDAIAHFAPQAIDVVGHLGDPAVDKLIQSAIEKSPQLSKSNPAGATIQSLINKV